MFTSWPLYAPVADWDAKHGGLSEWLGASVWLPATVDLFCPPCNDISVFTKLGGEEHAQAFLLKRTSHQMPQFGASIFIELTFSCARHKNLHFARLYLQVTSDSKVSKIGQFPSLADLSQPEFDRYQKVLGKARLAEVKRGIGLFAHGIGIGSLIYLRRAFEFLIEKAEAAALAANGGVLPYPGETRMRDRVRLLRDHLPDFIAENGVLYGILSDGLHNRSEDECKAMFAPCLDGIKLGLDQLEVERHRKERSKSARAALEKIQATLKTIDAQSGQQPVATPQEDGPSTTS